MATEYLPQEQPAAPAVAAAAAPALPSVSPAQIAIVKATAPVLKEHGVAITTLFYHTMIEENPSLRNIFNAGSQATGAQPRALAAAVLAYATYIDDLGRLHGAVERIAHKHASLQVTPDQYDIVGRYLMQAIGAVLGAAATPAIVDAWTAAYAVLAAVFIGREKTLYAEARTRDGGRGWVGWRPFTIAWRVPASADGNILALDLTPVDGRPLPSYRAGQYVSLQLPVSALGVLQSRQYSLCTAPAGEGRDIASYRICVRRDDGHDGTTLPGLISNLLHSSLHEGDQVDLSQPQGEFFFEPTGATDSTPLVLLSAGVGVTPLLAILEAVVGAKAANPVSWMHASHASASLPLLSEVRALQAAGQPGQIKTYVNLTATGEAEQAVQATATAENRVVVGTHLHLSDLSAEDRSTYLFLDSPQTQYFACGPANFMLGARTALEALGVGADRIHLELFATGDL